MVALENLKSFITTEMTVPCALTEYRTRLSPKLNTKPLDLGLFGLAKMTILGETNSNSTSIVGTVPGSDRAGVSVVVVVDAAGAAVESGGGLACCNRFNDAIMGTSKLFFKFKSVPGKRIIVGVFQRKAMKVWFGGLVANSTLITCSDWADLAKRFYKFVLSLAQLQ